MVDSDRMKGSYIVFTDLDGTLLDHDTYAWEAAAPALRLCRRLGVPVVLVSSKTRAEMQPLRQALGLPDPFVVENGGAVFFDAGDPRPEGASAEDGFWVWRFGESYPRLVQALAEIRKETGLPVKGFSDMRVEEIAELTGLGLEDARLAARREYDEPFIVQTASVGGSRALEEAARARGLQILTGGRFFHLQGSNDKGRAVRMLMAHYRRLRTPVWSIALGDSPNDFSMLEQVEYPVLIRSARDYSSLKKHIPNLTISSRMGPEGWNETVSAILGEMKEGEIDDGRL